MVRNATRLWFILALLLAACSQAPVEPTEPDEATAMSTEFADGALDVAVNAQGDAYVLGYQNRTADEFPERLFLARFGKEGEQTWFADLEEFGCAPEIDESGCVLAAHGVFATGGGIYALTTKGGESFNVEEQVTTTKYTTFVYKFAPGGTRLWKRALPTLVGDYSISAVEVGSSGQIYVAWATGNYPNVQRYLSAFDAEGKLRWFKKLDLEMTQTPYTQSSVRVALAENGSVFIAGIGELQKYGSEGTLLWSREFSFSDSTHLFVDLAVGGNENIYVVRSLTSEDVIPFNLEVKRFNGQGSELWTQTLVAPEEATFRNGYGSGPLEVSATGTLHMVVGSRRSLDGYTNELEESFLLLFNPNGQRSKRRTLTTESSVADIALAKLENPEHASVEGSPPFVDYFYVVGVEGAAGATECSEWGTGEPLTNPYCENTDAYIRQYVNYRTDISSSASFAYLWFRH